MKKQTAPCIVKPGSMIKLGDINPGQTPGYASHKEARDKIKSNLERLNALQGLLYAEHKRSLLICLQAMDAGGKDGLIAKVMGAMNPQGCRVVSFKEPTSLELDHDFMWRTNKELPRLGEVAVFNRSYYEDVLVARVHKLVDAKTIAKRYEQINAAENYLTQNNTHILKFFLHISKEEQLERFKDRLEDPAKNWKISDADFKEREFWDGYQQAFEAMLSHCSTKAAPWFVIPANHKWFRDLMVSQILVDYLENLAMEFPTPKGDMKALRKQYSKK